MDFHDNEDGTRPSSTNSNMRSGSERYTPYKALPPIRLPEQLKGCRRIQTRSAISARGILVVRLPDTSYFTRIGYESMAERACAVISLADGRTVDLVEQPFTLRYIDRLGRQRRYTFDYLVTRRDGRRIAIEVKHAARARLPKVLEKIREAAKHAVPKYADEVRVFTDRHYTRVQYENAEQLLNCRKHPDPEADALMEGTIRKFHGEITVADLVKLSELGNRAYPAVVRALYGNLLSWPKDRLIGPKMPLRREANQ